MLVNTKNGYGWVAITLHWLSALLVFGLFGLGLYMVELTYYDPWYKGSLDLHKSVGVCLALLLVARFIWRQFNTLPQGLSSHRLENQAAHLAHLLIYGLIAVLCLSGYLISTADGRSIQVFELFSLPATLTLERQEDIAGDIHRILAWSLIALSAVHMLAAFKHHLFNRDRTLMRMLQSGSRDS